MGGRVNGRAFSLVRERLGVTLSSPFAGYFAFPVAVPYHLTGPISHALPPLWGGTWGMGLFTALVSGVGACCWSWGGKLAAVGRGFSLGVWRLRDPHPLCGWHREPLGGVPRGDQTSPSQLGQGGRGPPRARQAWARRGPGAGPRTWNARPGPPWGGAGWLAPYTTRQVLQTGVSTLTTLLITPSRRDKKKQLVSV